MTGYSFQELARLRTLAEDGVAAIKTIAAHFVAQDAVQPVDKDEYAIALQASLLGTAQGFYMRLSECLDMNDQFAKMRALRELQTTAEGAIAIYQKNLEELRAKSNSD